MHLSVRTIESHLQRVDEKLGVSRRRELADALARRTNDLTDETTPRPARGHTVSTCRGADAEPFSGLRLRNR
jgi:hypothetical protein